MTIIYDSSSLQFNALNMFKDILLFEELDFFCLASPWISNISFSNSVLSTNLEFQRIFHEDLTLIDILKCVMSIAKKHNFRPTIIMHNFTTINSFDRADFNKTFKEIERCDDVINKYWIMRNSFFEHGIFNNIWIYSIKNLERMLSGSHYSFLTLINVVSELGKLKTQIAQNIHYLDLITQFLNIGYCVKLNGTFHAKIFVTSYGALAGSSNWTQNGFSYNDEINVYFANIEEHKDQYLGLKKRAIDLDINSTDVEIEAIEKIKKIHIELDNIYTTFLNEITGSYIQ